MSKNEKTVILLARIFQSELLRIQMSCSNFVIVNSVLIVWRQKPYGTKKNLTHKVNMLIGTHNLSYFLGKSLKTSVFVTGDAKKEISSEEKSRGNSLPVM